MRLFVYGTLMPGQDRWPALRPFASAWQPATAGGRLWDSGHGYPVARFGDGPPIPGFVVTVEADERARALTVLDRIEDEGSLFRRVEVVTSLGTATGYEWLGPTEGLAPLPGGWRPQS